MSSTWSLCRQKLRCEAYSPRLPEKVLSDSLILVVLCKLHHLSTISSLSDILLCFMFLTRTCLFINQKKIGQQSKPEIIFNKNFIEQQFGLAKWHHCSFWYWNWGQPFQKTLAKAQQTRWLSALTKVTSLGHTKITSSYTNLDQNSAQNLDQASITKSQPRISNKISTKLHHKNLNFKVLAKSFA